MKYYSYLILLSSLCSCEENGMEEATSFETVAPFHTLELNSVFEVYLIQDTLNAVKIECHRDGIKDALLTEENGILRISNRSTGKWLKPEKNRVKLYIHSNSLREVVLNETCYIKTINPITRDEFRIVMGHPTKLSAIELELNCKSFLYWNNYQCGGKVTLTGRAENLLIYSFALMTVDASALETDYTLIENHSKGDSRVRVENTLEYSIHGVGNIYLYGNPPEIIAHEVTSSGQLIHMD